MSVHRFQFAEQVPFADAEASLLLARWGTESLHGQARARLEARSHTDDDARTIDIDASTSPGQDLSRLFLGYLQQEFAHSAYRVDVLDVSFGARPAGSPSWPSELGRSRELVESAV